jgi:hypothetical protein
VQSHQQVIITFTNASASGRVAKKHDAQQAAAQRKASMQNFLAHNIEQQQAALSLSQLARREQDITLGEGKIAALVFGLTVRLLLVPHWPCFDHRR